MSATLWETLAEAFRNLYSWLYLKMRRECRGRAAGAVSEQLYIERGKGQITKADIVEKIAKRTGKSKREAEELTTLLFDLLKGALAGGEDIRVSGFGFLDVKEKAARTGRNPQIGEEITIESKKVLGFKPTKALNDAINAE